MPTYTAYFDGACEPVNPGGTAAYGAVLYKDGQRLQEWSDVYHPPAGRERDTTNNIAEYCGLIAVLEYMVSQGLQDEPLTIYGDSKLVIGQMWGTSRINEGLYVPHARRAKALCAKCSHLRGVWIPGAQNTEADALSRAPLAGLIAKRTFSRRGGQKTRS